MSELTLEEELKVAHIGQGRFVYSHSSLNLWRLCKRRWWHRYILHEREQPTANMAAGTWLVHRPIEDYLRTGVFHGLQQDNYYYKGLWDCFLNEFGGDDSYTSPCFTPDLPFTVMRMFIQSPLDSKNKLWQIEQTYFTRLGRFGYQSKPDVFNGDEQSVWDIKLKTFYPKYPTAGPVVNPLLPFDDQGLGQAACTKSFRFAQVQFYLSRKNGLLYGPYYQEHTVDPILLNEWRQETEATIGEIEAWLAQDNALPFPKNQEACNAFGRECPSLQECRWGFDKSRIPRQYQK